ncbi:MAG: helix-turn-helix domain-containing protein [Nocardioides sp.]
MTDETTNALRAVAHPVRLRMLSLLTGTELSAAEVARELGITHANASYHLRTLLDAGEVVIASEEKIRGGVAKRYRHPWEEEATRRPRQVASLEDRALYVRVMAEELVRRSRSSKVGARSHYSDAELWVSPEDYAAVMGQIHEASMALHGAAKPPRTEGTVRVNLTAALFEMEPGQREEDER